MEEFFKAFGKYIKVAEFNSFEFWIYPIGTILAIWLLTAIGLKIIPKGKSSLKTVFYIHNFWVVNSILVASIIIGLLCYWWATSYFSNNPIQLNLLISLFVALLIPIINFNQLKRCFTLEDIKEIISHPKTPIQHDKRITEAKKSYRKIKLFYMMLPLGFLFLLLILNPKKNLITIIYDNSSSMEDNKAIEALSETFDNLGDNNEIVLTTLGGPDFNFSGIKKTMNEILAVKLYSQLQAGDVVYYSDPISAKAGLNQITKIDYSPISESIWKSFLFISSNLSNKNYENRVLIIITDGGDEISNSIMSSKFFFDDEVFLNIFMPENTIVIDYSNGATNSLLQKFQEAGCEIFVASNSKQDYLDALDMTLTSFKRNWHLVFWTIIITVILSVIGLSIEPKRMS